MSTHAAQPEAFEAARAALRERPRRWLVTGAAGFIGSHLLETLLGLDQHVTVLDDFSTGHRANLDLVRAAVTPAQAARFTLVEGDLRDPEACRRACEGAEVVLHEAALGSVPRSIKTPHLTHAVNATGFLNVLDAARAAGIRRIVYASSSSVYGDHPALPKVEAATGRVLSPYAASKACDETYATAYGGCYGLELVGLRYFNVYGARQDPEGPYAAVMPRWFAALLRGREVTIHGDGETSRDFCYVGDVVQANLLAATTARAEALGQVYNVAYGARTTLTELFGLIRDEVARFRPEAKDARPVYGPFREGDVRHSLADVSKARSLLGYVPTHAVREGLKHSAAWYGSQAR